MLTMYVQIENGRETGRAISATPPRGEGWRAASADLLHAGPLRDDGDGGLVPVEEETLAAERLAEAREGARAAAARIVETARRLAVEGADAVKVAGWVDKASAVAAWRDAPDAHPETAAALAAEAEARGRGESVDALGATILAKAAALRQARGVIDGLESRALTAIETALAEELDGILARLRADLAGLGD